MNATCPLCGARLPDGEICEDLFTAHQLKEIDQPAFYAVHHLSVPCYMLQHNRYSRQGWLAVRELLGRFVNGLTPADARREMQTGMDSGQRKWSLVKGEKLAGVEKIAWRFTIADVRLDSPANYCADVRRWAESILVDSESLIRDQGTAD